MKIMLDINAKKTHQVKLDTFASNNTPKTNEGLRSYKWDWDGIGWMDGSLGGMKYRSFFSANNL